MKVAGSTVTGKTTKGHGRDVLTAYVYALTLDCGHVEERTQIARSDGEPSSAPRHVKCRCCGK